MILGLIVSRHFSIRLSIVLHIVQAELLAALCSKLPLQGYLYSKQPWNIDIVSLSEQRAGKLLIQHNKKERKEIPSFLYPRVWSQGQRCLLHILHDSGSLSSGFFWSKASWWVGVIGFLFLTWSKNWVLGHDIQTPVFWVLLLLGQYFIFYLWSGVSSLPPWHYKRTTCQIANRIKSWTFTTLNGYIMSLYASPNLP